MLPFLLNCKARMYATIAQRSRNFHDLLLVRRHRSISVIDDLEKVARRNGAKPSRYEDLAESRTRDDGSFRLRRRFCEWQGCKKCRSDPRPRCRKDTVTGAGIVCRKSLV